MRKKTEKNKRRPTSSRRLRQLRLLILIGMVAGAAFYWKPLVSIVQAWLPVKSVPAAGLVLPAQEGAVTSRKGTVYTVTGQALKALKPDGTVIWERNMPHAGTAVLPSYDGVFVKPDVPGKLLRYTSLGKLMAEIPVPGPYTHVYESVNGILFEERSLQQYTWVDSSGGLLGSQQIPGEHIIKTAVDPDSGDTVIATLKTDGGTLESALHRFDSHGRLTGARTFRNAVLLNMQFVGTRLIVVLDDRLISLNEQMKDHWVVQEPAIYQAVSFGSAHFWVNRVQTGLEGNQVLQCYSLEGKVLFTVPFKDRLTLLAAGENNQVAAVSGQRVQIFSGKGVLDSEFQLVKVPEKILWLNDKRLLIFYGDSVSIENSDKRMGP